MGYQPIFNPPPAEPLPADRPGDRRDGSVYLYTPEIELAVNVALAAGRPLLVRGPSGGGKSTLAGHVARVLGWRYYEKVISSRTQAQDLLWEIDHLRRLQDAQLNNLRGGIGSYLNPGVLWWGFDNASARHQARQGEASLADPNLNPGASAAQRAVVLLDEIDKADPDVPNNLLVPLGSFQFQVAESAPVKISEESAPLVIITTNDERDLPPAFLRRCVELVLPAPDRPRLLEIGRLHWPRASVTLRERLADLVLSAPADGTAPVPSIAEYLDAIRACDKLGVEPDSERWKNLINATLWKHGRTGKAAG
ncbi:MAG TPA: MoxR family ATPase [Thermoanaerobaculia bacterium]|jgi:MoxR-like ATPase|nr:MoxR family ATPase [Thermoanaerobaculia bacterium]